MFEQLRGQGFVRARVDQVLVDLDDVPKLDKRRKHSIEVVVDRFKLRQEHRQRIAESLETCLELAGGVAKLVAMEETPDAIDDVIFSSKFACTQCGYSLQELEPRLFSFNNPAGACHACDGLGVDQYFDPEKIIVDDELNLAEGAIKGWDRRSVYYFQLLEALARHYGFDIDKPLGKLAKKHRDVILYGSKQEAIAFEYQSSRGHVTLRTHPFEGVIPNLERRYKETDSEMMREELAKFISEDTCKHCEGSRLRLEARNVFVDDRPLSDITHWPIGEAFTYYQQLSLPGQKGKIASKILKEISDRLRFLVNVGLEYLSLERSADTLSGGEAQRIRLASQIGAGLVGVMYILDEPSIGLHQRDNDRLLKTLKDLRDLGNTVIVVEHDEDAMRSADFLLDIGPGAGVQGGEIVASGTPKAVLKSSDSLTARYLSGKECIEVPEERYVPHEEGWLSLFGASGNNLQQVDLHLPLGLMTCVTGVSGSGKSTLINRTLYPICAHKLNRSGSLKADAYQHIEGLDELDKVVDIDQSPIGRTPRSNPATYTGLLTGIRELFAGTQESRARGYKPGRFSFNVRGGRCEACQGDGVIRVEMHFLADMYVPCDQCHGKRYNRETLEVLYKGKNIHQILEMTVEEAHEFFTAIPALARKLHTLMDVGLSYIKLGQSATTLSGGEAQRVKLARELSKRDTGSTLYILDEPTTGLHFHDIKQLLKVLHELRNRGNTVVVIEHNLDVIKTADWIIDLGPEGGSGGGYIIAEGPPETIIKEKKSHTGRFLKPFL